MKQFYILILILIPVCQSSCGHTSGAKSCAHAVETADAGKELPLPEVPSTLVSPEERAAYVMRHFWDAMDFNDTKLCRDTAFMEQNFVNFISVFPHADKPAGGPAFSVLVTKAAPNPDALRLISGMAELYLAYPNSPMRDEEYYIMFLEQLLGVSSLPESDRLRPAYQLEMAYKNRPGTTAGDFRFIGRDGRQSSLHDTRGESLLLIFYDPDCGHCPEILRQVYDSPVIGQNVAEGRLTVLAIYAEGNRKLWDETKDAMPRQWKVGFETGGILEKGLYSLPAMPVIYLLDRDKTVLLKDATVERVEEWTGKQREREGTESPYRCHAARKTLQGASSRAYGRNPYDGQPWSMTDRRVRKLYGP